MSTATDSSRNDSNSINNYKHAAPIPILTSPHRRRLSTSSDGSPISPPAVQTPNSFYPTNLAPSSPTGSSFFSQLISTSPKASATFPYKRPSGFAAPPVFEDDEGQEVEARNSLHQRRATTAWAGSGRTAPQPAAPAPPAPPVIEAQHARGAGVLRRLSLGGGLNSSFYQGSTNASASPPRPATPPPSAVTPVTASGLAANPNNTGLRSRVRRSATLTTPPTNPRQRAPSPMGERILKGHFDGFN